MKRSVINVECLPEHVFLAAALCEAGNLDRGFIEIYLGPWLDKKEYQPWKEAQRCARTLSHGWLGNGDDDVIFIAIGHQRIRTLQMMTQNSNSNSFLMIVHSNSKVMVIGLTKRTRTKTRRRRRRRWLRKRRKRRRKRRRQMIEWARV